MRLLILVLAVLGRGSCSVIGESPNLSFQSPGQVDSSQVDSGPLSASNLLSYIRRPVLFYDSVSQAVASAPSLVNWLFSNEKYTTFDTSDDHEVELSKQNHQMDDLGRNASFTAPLTLTEQVAQAAQAGRQIFSGTNALTIGYESIMQTVTCLANNEYTDPDLGTFGLDAAKYCDPKCGRLIPGILCCAPMTPQFMDIKLRLKVKGQPERMLNFRDPSDRQYLTSQGRVVFIVHGWVEKMSTLKWITDMRDGFEEMGENAIIVDWRRGNAVHYWQAIANTRVVGAIIGRAILNWEIADRTLVVGFSLGGQIVGEAGRYTQEHGGVLINECHGLDPAGPFYDGASDDITLDKSDCRLVQAIHTSAEDVRALSLIAIRFGTYKKSGHCDYWVNCGFNQGPCIDLDFRDLVKAYARLAVMSDGEMINYISTRACSHWRSPELYNSALRGRCDAIQNPIVSHPCRRCGEGHYCNLGRNALLPPNNTFPPFSTCSPDMDVNYYVSSGQSDPFCPQEERQSWSLF